MIQGSSEEFKSEINNTLEPGVYFKADLLSHTVMFFMERFRQVWGYEFDRADEHPRTGWPCVEGFNPPSVSRRTQLRAQALESIESAFDLAGDDEPGAELDRQRESD